MSLTAEQRQALLVKLLAEYMLDQHTQGELLQYLRKNVLGVTQTKYAEIVGVNRKTLSEIEQDKSSPLQSIVDKVFKPFGLKAGVVPLHKPIVEELIRDIDSQG